MSYFSRLQNINEKNYYKPPEYSQILELMKEFSYTEIPNHGQPVEEVAKSEYQDSTKYWIILYATGIAFGFINPFVYETMDINDKKYPYVWIVPNPKILEYLSGVI